MVYSECSVDHKLLSILRNTNKSYTYPLTRANHTQLNNAQLSTMPFTMKDNKQNATAMNIAKSGEHSQAPGFYLSGQLTEDFPELNSKRIKKPAKKEGQILYGNENTKTNENLSTSVGECLNETPFKEASHKKCKNSQIRLDSCVSSKSWKPKTKDPITFNLSQALQIKTEKCKTVIKKADPKTNHTKLVGNILDSDQPQQRKGKVRPNKVRRPSALKKKLLADRIERRTQTDSKEDEDFAIEAVQLLFTESHLIKDHCPLIDITHLDNDSSSVNKQCYNESSSVNNQCSNESSSVNNQCSNESLSVNNQCTNESSSVNNKCTNESSSVNNRCSNESSSVNNQCSNESLSVNNQCTIESSSVNNQCSNMCLGEQFNKSIHSRRFREYCTNCLTEELVTSVVNLLEKMAYFQDRMFARDPIRAQGKRRYVAGIHQTNKYLKVKKVKILIIAPDLERSSGEGGLDEKVNYMKTEAESQGLPCVFGPRRKTLGKAVCKKSLVSCVAVLNYEGAEELFSNVLVSLEDAKLKYLKLTCQFPEPTKEVTRYSPQVLDNKSAEMLITSPLLATLREKLPA